MPEPDPDKREFLRDVAEEVRDESGESKQVSALLYRVSDLYDEKEQTSTRDVYVNMRNIIRTKHGGDPDPEGLDDFEADG